MEKRMKRISAIILFTALVLVLTSCGGEKTPASDFEYKAIASGVEITKYIGTAIKVNIPAKIEGVAVTSIGEYAFYESGIMEVYIPEGLTNIGHGVFMDCTGLTSVTIPDSVTNIGNLAFHRIENLTVTYKGQKYNSVGNERYGEIYWDLPEEFYELFE